eukprot:14869453-Heterocapsa_arctica.AAC.1
MLVDGEYAQPVGLLQDLCVQLLQRCAAIELVNTRVRIFGEPAVKDRSVSVRVQDDVRQRVPEAGLPRVAHQPRRPLGPFARRHELREH